MLLHIKHIAVVKSAQQRTLLLWNQNLLMDNYVEAHECGGEVGKIRLQGTPVAQVVRAPFL